MSPKVENESSGCGISCASVGCDKKGSMVCPTCRKLGLPSQYSNFCSQECFKKSWALHKSIHKLYKSAISKGNDGEDNGLPAAFRGFSFTGPLRPWRVTPQDTVPDHIQAPDYAKTGIPLSEQEAKATAQIPIYTPEEIEGVRAACKIGREVLDVAGRAIRPGITTDEIDKVVFNACVERDSYPSPLNYYDFPKSVCTSVNEVICHGIPDERPLEEGDIINLDISVYHKGYHADLNETFFVGMVDEESVRLVKTAYECLRQAIEKVKPGTMYRELGPIISKVAHAEGLSVVRSYCGHGIGKLFHCAPNVPHYARNKAVGVMKPGHIFTIEPMINQGTWKDKLWPDDWTAATVDGSRSAQFEHTILVTETGCELLTARVDQEKMEWDRNLFQRPLP